MNENIEKLIEAIKADYSEWIAASGENMGTDAEISNNMIEEFENSVEVSVGSKYIKIVTNGSVWGFIVNTDVDKKFQKGDILKPAGYSAPARNFARGNVVTNNYNARWTGPF